MRKSRSRSRSKARTYTVLGNQTVDARSKQLLFNEFELCTMGRTSVRGEDTFTETVANSLLEKHMKKRKPVGYVNFLIDRMRFGKQSGLGNASNREYLTYREIKQLYTFLSRPNVFMLGVEEESTGKRSYETYMCKNVDDMTRIQELIKQSTSDPQYLLRTNQSVIPSMISTPTGNEEVNRRSPTILTPASHVQPVQNASLPPQLSGRYSTRYKDTVSDKTRVIHHQTSPIQLRRPISRSPERYESPPSPRSLRQSRPITIRASQPNLHWDRNYPSGSISPVHTTPTPRIRHSRRPSPSPSPSPDRLNDDRLYHRSRVISVKRRTGILNGVKPRARSLSNEPELLNTLWRDDITYLTPNAATGPEVTDRGSVFLYVSRTKRNQTTDTNSTDSIPRYAITSRNGYTWDRI